MAKSKRLDLGVDWFLPGAKRRIATTTRASSDLIALLAEDGLTWAQMVGAIIYDPEAKAVAQIYVDRGHGSEIPVVF